MLDHPPVLSLAMNWYRVATAVVLPAFIAVPVAAVFWSKRQFMMGTVVGAGVLLFAAIWFGGLEYVDGLRFRMGCEQANLPCRPSNPSDFVRMSAYGFVAMFQVMLLFVTGAIVENRHQRRHYDPEWR